MLGFTPYAVMRPEDAFPRAKATAAQTALALDDGLGKAHASLGACALLYDWDRAASERAFQESISRTPDNVGARVWHSTLLATVGHHDDDAIEEARRATEIDPLSVIAAAHVSLRLYNAGRYSAATVAAEKAIELDPQYRRRTRTRAAACQGSGQLADAIDSAETVVSIVRTPHSAAYLGGLYGAAAVATTL